MKQSHDLFVNELSIFESEHNRLNKDEIKNDHSVASKLALNDLRKRQIETSQSKHKEYIIQKRRHKQQLISVQLQKMFIHANCQRELHIRENKNMLEERKRLQEIKLVQISNKYHLNEQKILYGRKKVDENKHFYVLKKKQEHQKKMKQAQRKRQLIKTTDFHFHNQSPEKCEFNCQIYQKNQGNIQTLYERHKKKNNWIAEIILKANQNDIAQTSDKKQIKDIVAQVKQTSLLVCTKKVEYFGIYQEDQMQICKRAMHEMKKLINLHSQIADPLKDEQLINRFQQLIQKQLQ